MDLGAVETDLLAVGVYEGMIEKDGELACPPTSTPAWQQEPAWHSMDGGSKGGGGCHAIGM